MGADAAQSPCVAPGPPERIHTEVGTLGLGPQRGDDFLIFGETARGVAAEDQLPIDLDVDVSTVSVEE